MRRIKPLIMSIGVVLLSTAPIFSVAQAQQSSQSRMLLEMQQMRQEISELRDMVERQQYQLRKLQQAGSRVQTAPARQNPNFYPGANPQPGQPTETVPAAGAQSDSGLTYQGQYQAGSATTGVDPNRGGGVQPTQVPVQGGDQYYRPYNPGDTATGDRVNSAADSVYSQQGGVEERVITAPRLPTEQGGGFPPVVDRSIGGVNQPLPGDVVPRVDEVQVVDQNPSDTSWQNSPSRVIREPGQQNTNVLPTPSAGGVIAVPSASTVAVPNPSQVAQSANAYDNNQVATAAPSDQAGIPAALSESDYYSQGFDLMKQSKFDEAVAVFEQQLKAYPRGDSADDAHYWIAEAMYVSRNLDVAKKHLKTLVQDYPQSRRVPDAMLKTAYIEQQQGNQIEARILFQEIVNYHPKSDAAIAARNRLEDSN